jgi:hypothetical protein
VILQTNKDKGKTNDTVPDSNSKLVKLMTHHNQSKELITWFLITLAYCYSDQALLSVTQSSNEHGEVVSPLLLGI